MLGGKIGQGNTADIYAWGEDRILKVFRHPILLEIEWNIGRLIGALPVTAPQIYGIVEAQGKRGIVYERVRGRTMMTELAERPDQAELFGRELARLHSEMHGHPGTGLPPLKEALTQAMRRASDILPAHKADAVVSYLSGLPDGAQICHGDFHPDNVLLGPEGPITIDWMTAVSGPPAADAARTLLLLRHAELPEALSEPVKLSFTALRTRLLHAYEETYLQLSGLTPSELARWELPLMAARLGENNPQKEREKLLKLVDERLEEAGKL